MTRETILPLQQPTVVNGRRSSDYLEVSLRLPVNCSIPGLMYRPQERYMIKASTTYLIPCQASQDAVFSNILSRQSTVCLPLEFSTPESEV